MKKTLALLFLLPFIVPAVRAEPFTTPLAVDNLDPAAFSQWVDGLEGPIPLKDGPRHVIWTATTAPEWDGLRFGDGRSPGVRYLRIGWKTAIPLGSVLVRSGGQLSALKPTAAYPGNLSDEKDWLPAVRLKNRQVSRDEVESEEYAIWVFPPGTTTCALRFTHTASPTENTYSGWLGGAYILPERMVNVAPQAVAAASSNDEQAVRINNGTNDGTWAAWSNGTEGSTQTISAAHPEWIILTWPVPVPLTGLNALWAGFGATSVDVYTGPAGRHPREAAEADWRPLKEFTGLQNQYPRQLGPNWMDFGAPVTTRALRLRLTSVTQESHPHLTGNTKGGKRVWLGELMALEPLGDRPLESAVLPLPAAAVPLHPPIPVRFNLKEPGYVTLVIEDAAGKRVRNLVSETLFPAGQNTAWWDGMDDLARDPEAASHGLYHIPGALVAPGAYRVRGLYRKAVDLRYEFSVYNAGSPAWETADHTGAWLTNHTPPSSALFVPAEKAPGGKPLVFLGSYVAEGGHGLAWVDLDGRKQGGQGNVGGSWTGAPYLARDAGPDADPNVYAYAGAPWGELRLTALGKDGQKPVVTPPWKFPGTPDDNNNPNSVLGGIAVYNGLLVASLPKLGQILFVDCKGGKVLGKADLPDPRGVFFDGQGRLLALSGKKLLRYTLPAAAQINDTFTLPASQTVVADGLEDPQGITLDAQGNIYLSDRGSSHQVKVFSPAGQLLRSIGQPGAPKAGPYDPNHMNNPNGLTIDSRDRLWVAESDFQPKRVSVWTLDGKLVNAFYGPGQYGGGGTLDPKDPTRFYYTGMEFKLDWKSGTDRVTDVFFRPGPGDLQLPNGYGSGGMPEWPLTIGGREYLTNAYNSNPTNGAGITMLWLLRDGVAHPVAALGRANDWDLFKGDAFKGRWPAGIDLKGEYWHNQAVFAWSDLNGDGQVQPEEVTFQKGSAGGMTVMADGSVLASRVDDRAVRYHPLRFTPAGAPVYDLAAGETLLPGAQSPTTSGGDQALLSPDGWAVSTVAPKPFAPQGMGGGRGGQALWSYPSLWPGLHASHEAPTPDRPGEIIGTTRLLGGFVTPRGSDAGPLWAVNGNMGNMYLFTADGLFVATLFNDVRQGRSWSMPMAQRGMLLNDLSLHDENFWPSISQSPDGKVYLVDGGRTSLVRVDGLDTIRRIPATSLPVTADNLKSAEAYLLQNEAQRQKLEGGGTLKVAIRAAAPVVDGKLDDWTDASWATVDRRGVAANFNSNSKPYDVSGAVTIAGDRLYAAFRTGDPNLLNNSGEMPQAPFKTGGALDLMIGSDPAAPATRQKPAAGDERLLVTMVKGKPLAVLYRAVVPGTAHPVPFSSPWRTITLDQVEDVSAQVQLAGADGNYEISIPLATMGLHPAAGQHIKGDIGILRGNGFQTLQRVYWSNKATAIVSDVPSEAELTPGLWGTWEVVGAS